MCDDENGQYSAGSGLGMGSCSVVQPISNPPTLFSYCSSFDDVQLSANQPSGYRDADWIQSYNGHSNGDYYLWWTSTGWVFKYQTTDKGAGYVPTVCGYAPY